MSCKFTVYSFVLAPFFLKLSMMLQILPPLSFDTGIEIKKKPENI